MQTKKARNTSILALVAFGIAQHTFAADSDDKEKLIASAAYTLGTEDFNDFFSGGVSDIDGGLDDDRNLTRVHTFEGSLQYTDKKGHSYLLALEHEIDGESRDLTTREITLGYTHLIAPNGKHELGVQGSYEEVDDEFETGLTIERSAGWNLWGTDYPVVPSAGFTVSDLGAEDDLSLRGTLKPTLKDFKALIWNNIKPMLELQASIDPEEVGQGPRVELGLSFALLPFEGKFDNLEMEFGGSVSHDSDDGKPDGAAFITFTLNSEDLLPSLRRHFSRSGA